MHSYLWTNLHCCIVQKHSKNKRSQIPHRGTCIRSHRRLFPSLQVAYLFYFRNAFFLNFTSLLHIHFPKQLKSAFTKITTIKEKYSNRSCCSVDVCYTQFYLAMGQTSKQVTHIPLRSGININDNTSDSQIQKNSIIIILDCFSWCNSIWII